MQITTIYAAKKYPGSLLRTMSKIQNKCKSQLITRSRYVCECCCELCQRYKIKANQITIKR